MESYREQQELSMPKQDLVIYSNQGWLVVYTLFTVLGLVGCSGMIVFWPFFGDRSLRCLPSRLFCSPGCSGSSCVPSLCDSPPWSSLVRGSRCVPCPVPATFSSVGLRLIRFPSSIPSRVSAILVFIPKTPNSTALTSGLCSGSS